MVRRDVGGRRSWKKQRWVRSEVSEEEACEVSPEAKNGLGERASPDEIYKTGSVIYFYFMMSISTFK